MSKWSCADQPTRLYRIFDASARLLYVGVAVNLTERLSTHERQRGWDVTKVKVETYPDRITALRAEADAILTEDPVFNKAGRPIERALKWHLAYPDRTAEDVTDNEVEQWRAELAALRQAARDGEIPVGVMLEQVRQLTASPKGM